MTSSISFSVEARYPHQVWEIEVPLPIERFAGTRRRRRAAARPSTQSTSDLFAVADPESAVEIVAWRAHARCVPAASRRWRAGAAPGAAAGERTRRPIFPETGAMDDAA